MRKADAVVWSCQYRERCVSSISIEQNSSVAGHSLEPTRIRDNFGGIFVGRSGLVRTMFLVFCARAKPRLSEEGTRAPFRIWCFGCLVLCKSFNYCYCLFRLCWCRLARKAYVKALSFIFFLCRYCRIVFVLYTKLCGGVERNALVARTLLLYHHRTSLRSSIIAADVCEGENIARRWVAA